VACEVFVIRILQNDCFHVPTAAGGMDFDDIMRYIDFIAGYLDCLLPKVMLNLHSLPILYISR